MAPWSGLTNAIGGAFKNIGDMFGGDPHQSFLQRIGKGFSAAYDLGLKAPVETFGTAASLGAEGFDQFSKLDQRAYTDLVSHPLSDVINMSAKALYSTSTQGLGAGFATYFSPHSWIDSWEQSSHFSPGQEVMLASNNFGSAVEKELGTTGGYAFSGLTEGPGVGLQSTAIDPGDPAAVNKMITGSGWGGRVVTGSLDGMLRWYVDPGQKVMKYGGEYLKALKNNPIKSSADIERVMNLPRTQRLINWTIGKDAATIAEHPALRDNAFRWSVANALSGARTYDEASALMRTLMGDKRAYEELLASSQALAFRNANLLAPSEVMEKFALASGDAGVMERWLQPVEKAKSAAAQAQLNADLKRLTDVMSAAGSMTDRTSSSYLSELSAATRAGAKFATPRLVDSTGLLHPARLVSYIQGHAYNTPIRIYHALTDKPAMGFINHGDDSAPDQVRSWLNKSKVLAPEEKQDFAQQYARMTKGQRAAGWSRIEDKTYARVAEAYGISNADMAHVLNETRARQSVYAAGARSGAYGVISTPTGEKLNLLATGDGEIVAHPDLITQLQQGATPMANISDLERAIRAMDRNGILDRFRGPGALGVDALTDLLDRVYGIWKPLSLLSMHRAYNHIGDDLLRGAAKLGGAAMVRNFYDGAGNFLSNRMAPFTKSMWVRNQEAQYEQMVQTAKSQANGLAAHALDQKQRIADGETIPARNLVTTQNVLNAHARYRYLRDNRPTFIRDAHRLGTGNFVVPGTRIRVDEAFGGPNSDYWRQLTSSEQFFQSQMNDPAQNMYQTLMSNSMGAGFTVIRPSDGMKIWTRAYLHYVNNQLRPDPVAKMLIRGTEPAQVEKWLSDTASGQQYMKALHKADTQAQVQAVADHVQKYLPNNRLKLAAQSRRGVTAQDINATWHTASQMPEVNGNLNLMMHGGHPAVLSLRNTTNYLLKVTGSLPDDIMVRHPVFNQLYKNRVGNAIRVAAEQAPGGMMTTEEIGRLQNMSMRQARKDLQNLVYDTSRFNDAGHLLRFISPFFNAWFNALSSWSKLFAENPALLARTAIAKDAIWGSPLAVDTTTGLPAKPDTPMANLAIVAHMPKPLASALGAGDLSYVPISAAQLISPTYADSIGNPGFGPLVQIPVNQLAKMSPSVAEDPMVQAILGQRITANSLQSVIPSSATQALGMLGLAGLTGQSSDALNRASLTWSIYQEQMYQYQSGQRATPPNIKDIQGQAGYTSALDAILNRLLPLGFKPKPEHQFFVDQYHSMLDQDPTNAQSNFVRKYGEQAYVFTQSLGKNSAGVPPTAGGIQAYHRYQDVIAQDPALAPVVIGVLGAGNFDEMAYQWEVANGLRTYQTPQEAATAANVGQGWFNYQQVMAKINIVLQQRGLASINQTGAADLKKFRTDYVNSTNDPKSPNYNPDFYAAYGSFNKNAYMQRIQALERLAVDPGLLANPLRADIRGLNAYFQLRDQALSYMQGRTNTSIKLASNKDVANWFDFNVGQLMQDDTQFATLWNRYLKDDDLTQP